jgi:hypothetical protein
MAVLGQFPTAAHKQQSFELNGSTDMNSQDGLMFTVDGTIQALRIAPAVMNLLSDIQTDAIFTDAIAELSENSTRATMCDGEDVEHIALLIDGRFAVGTFEWLQDLEIGDNVTLVVTTICDGPLLVHAILRKNDQLLWTPYSIHHTRHGWIMHSIKLGALVTIGTWLTFGIFYLIGDRPTTGVMVNILIFIALLNAFVLYMSTKSVLHLGEEAERIFRALNVPRFENFRIKPYSVLNMDFQKDPDYFKKKYIFRFAAALEAHKKRFNII